MLAEKNENNRALLWSGENKASPDWKSAKNGAIDVSCGKNPKEEKENTETHYHSSLLHLQTSGFRKSNGWMYWMPEVVSRGVCWCQETEF